MHTDTTAVIPTIYVKASELLEPDGQESFNKLLASFSANQQARKVQRDPFGQSCAVAPIVRMDKAMDEVMQNVVRRIARKIIKETYGYELNYCMAVEYMKHGDKKKALEYGEKIVDEVVDAGWGHVLGGKQE